MSEWDDDNEYDDDEDPGRSRRPIVLGVLAVLVLALAGVIAYRLLRKDPTSASTTPNATAVTSTTVATVDSAGSTPITAASSPAVPSTAVETSSSAPVSATTTTTASSPSTTSSPAAGASTTTSAAAAPTEVATTEVATTAVATTAVAVNAPTYDTLPDGTPAPIVAVFGADKITLSGNVPDQAAKDYLQALAIANARTPVPVDNLLTIDPTVPRAIGARIVELTSARFDPGSARVSGAHAKELDRITAIMNALPNTTVMIIGHADQIGSSNANFNLSAQRAAAVVTYLVQSGINPQRLASRAVGDTDLLTLNSDAASLALNRRTEFIIYGLLGTPAPPTT